MYKLASVAVVLIATACFAISGPVPPHEAEILGDRVIELLVKRDPGAVAQLMHYPPSYTKKQREEDIAGVESMISFLLRRFGTVSEVKRERGRVAFFEIGGGGGDMPYWQSLSPLETFDVIYSAHFSKLGVGVINVRVFHHPSVSRLGIVLIGFGLPVSRPDAKSQVISAIKEMMRLRGEPIPPNIDEILEKNLKPQGDQA